MTTRPLTGCSALHTTIVPLVTIRLVMKLDIILTSFMTDPQKVAAAQGVQQIMATETQMLYSVQFYRMIASVVVVTTCPVTDVIAFNDFPTPTHDTNTMVELLETPITIMHGNLTRKGLVSPRFTLLWTAKVTANVMIETLELLILATERNVFVFSHPPGASKYHHQSGLR
jgi:hypothetical protein